MAHETTAVTKSKTTWCEPQLSSEMRDLVRMASGHCPGIRYPEITAQEYEEVQRLLAAYEEGLSGTSAGGIARMIGGLATIYPAARISDREAKVRLELYVELLSDIPQDALSAAMREVARVSRFFPTVAEIREAADEFLSDRRETWAALHSLAWQWRYDNKPFDHRRQLQ